MDHVVHAQISLPGGAVNTGGVEPRVARDSERPEPWEAVAALSDEAWPEYNTHGQPIGYYWPQLEAVFPEWQFVLCDPADETVLAEGSWMRRRTPGLRAQPSARPIARPFASDTRPLRRKQAGIAAAH